jgi:hypothetical protein
MSNAETVVDKSRGVLGILENYVAKMPRDKKFTIGDRLIDRGLSVLEGVTEAYYAPRNEKKERIRKINVQIEVLRQIIRYLFERNDHNLSKHEHHKFIF